MADLALRLVRALLPVATLYVGKLIIDEVIRLAGLGGPPASPRQWLAGGRLDHLGWLLDCVPLMGRQSRPSECKRARWPLGGSH